MVAFPHPPLSETREEGSYGGFLGQSEDFRFVR